MTGMVTGVRAGELIFFSAIRGRNPQTNKSPDGIREQAAQAFENLKVLMESRGLTLGHIVKVTLYLNDLADRLPFHDVWLTYFPSDAPARTDVRVADANASPGGNARFVLDVVARAH